ncbi:Heterogeneous nuclear ribonucleoprotein R (RRM superfamily) protein [Dioscorea alata]|uniref:Heterogeneous nuclear ribonucleoprotein R (RRM superfamily) protein n=1 Tax=Dioscorea alata TaxID=55571 RepID=A0ACB7VM40_DIOAL|nr:Heterogeneous nuclear ribonucleoprotein R (RRM superfamily) protein [Dioscorea alata]
MPPKASAGGGRRKTVRKTVRRTTPRSNSRAKAQAPAESPPLSPAPLTADESHVIAPISEETPEITPIADKTPEITPIAEPSSSPSMPQASETTASEPVAEVAAAEEAPAIEEPTAVEAPTPAAQVPEPTPKKTVTRVRKVVKKKIVVKKVPKASVTVKDDVQTEEEAVVPPIVVAEGCNPNSDSIPQSTKAVAVEHLEPPLMAQETEVKVEKIEAAEPSAQRPRAEVETKKIASEEVKQEPMQEDEVKQVLIQEDEVQQDQMQEEEVKQEQMQEEEVKQEQLQEEEMKQEEIESGAAEEADALPDQDQKDGIEAQVSAGDVEKGISERQRRRKTEIFIGGLDRDAKEEDIRKVFETVGEIVEVRMMMDALTGKNKGYAFLRYAEATQAKKAVTVFKKVEVCGKLCGAAALEGNDTIFLGSIDKTWKKEDIIKLLHEIGVEKIDAVTVMTDPKNADLNRGFAFLELESNRDAQKAFKLLQKKDVFGKGRNIKVAWAEPLNDPDEEEMQKVKSVYVEGIPFSWGEEQLKERFEKFGNIERVVLARNIRSAKRKDFAFVNYKTREDALSCIELFEKEELMDSGSKINVKVSLAKPISKGKQNKGGFKFNKKDDNKDKTTFVQRDMKINGPSSKGNLYKGGQSSSAGDRKSTSTHELLDTLRHQTPWKQGQPGYSRGPNLQDYSHPSQGGKRAFAALGDEVHYSDLRGYPRPRLDTFPPAGPSYGVMPHAIPSSSVPYHQRPTAGYTTGGLYGATDHPSTYQMRQGGPPYYGGNLYPRCKPH